MKKLTFLIILLWCYHAALAQLNLGLQLNFQPDPDPREWPNQVGLLVVTTMNTTNETHQFKYKGRMTLNGELVMDNDIKQMPVETIGPFDTEIREVQDVLPPNALSVYGDLRKTYIKTGQIPAGNYLVCAQIFDLQNKPLSTEMCVPMLITAYQQPSIIFPTDNMELPPNAPPTFTWTPVVPPPPFPVTYRLMVAEVPADLTTEGNTPIPQYAYRQMPDHPNLWQLLNDDGQPYALNPVGGNGENARHVNEHDNGRSNDTECCPAISLSSGGENARSVSEHQNGKSNDMECCPVISPITPTAALRAMQYGYLLIDMEIPNQTQAIWPPDVEGPQPGKQYVWMVQALREDGQPIGDNNGTSPIGSFYVPYPADNDIIAEDIGLVLPQMILVLDTACYTLAYDGHVVPMPCEYIDFPQQPGSPDLRVLPDGAVETGDGKEVMRVGGGVYEPAPSAERGKAVELDAPLVMFGNEGVQEETNVCVTQASNGDICLDVVPTCSACSGVCVTVSAVESGTQPGQQMRTSLSLPELTLRKIQELLLFGFGQEEVFGCMGWDGELRSVPECELCLDGAYCVKVSMNNREPLTTFQVEGDAMEYCVYGEKWGVCEDPMMPLLQMMMEEENGANARVGAAVASGPCPEEDVVLRTQEDVDAFGAMWPDCEEIRKNLIIGDYSTPSDIENLYGLKKIKHIKGYLSIINNPLQNNIFGLEKLSSVRYLYVYGNESLSSLSGLENLSSATYVIIYVNKSLTSLVGLEKLSSVNRLDIYGNESLANLNGLESLTIVESYLSLYRNPSLISLSGLEKLSYVGLAFNIWYNYSLSSISELESLTFVGDKVSINSNSMLSNCSIDYICNNLHKFNTNEGNNVGCKTKYEIEAGCFLRNACPTDLTLTTQAEIDAFPSTYQGCTEILGNLTIEGATTTSINNLNGLSGITSIGGFLSIRNNDALTDISGLGQLGSVGDYLHIYRNRQLPDLNGLQNLTSIGTNIDILDNINMTSLSALNGISSVNGFLRIYNNAVTDLSGLGQITSVGGYLHITYCNRLTSLNGLNQLTSVGGRLTIDINPTLTSLSALSQLESIGEGLHIADNAALPNVNGLEKITQVPGYVRISLNNSLNNLNGLSNLTSIGEYLHIDKNRQLPNLSGLGSLVSIGKQLTINENGSLTSLDGLSQLASIGGSLEIYNHLNLTSLEGLLGLNSMRGMIYISSNPTLSTLLGLQNINPSGIVNLTLKNCPNLNLCSVESICAYLDNPDNPATMTGNISGCNSRMEVKLGCE